MEAERAVNSSRLWIITKEGGGNAECFAKAPMSGYHSLFVHLLCFVRLEKEWKASGSKHLVIAGISNHQRESKWFLSSTMCVGKAKVVLFKPLNTERILRFGKSIHWWKQKQTLFIISQLASSSSDSEHESKYSSLKAV